MAKQKTEVPDSWSGRMKEWGGGDFTFLSSDGETITFIVVGLPRLLKSVYKGKVQERIGCPVVTDTGFQLLVVGKRVGRKLSKFESKFATNALMVTRRGVEGDVNAKYEVTVVQDQATYASLWQIASIDFTPDLIDDAVKAVEEIMQG